MTRCPASTAWRRPVRISLSLSTTKQRFAEELHELADTAYFNRTVIVASAHNLPVSSYPWRFSSVISVGSHEEPEALTWYANPSPPVELFARGVDVARTIFAAEAATIFLHDEEADELVFEAVSGRGEEDLVGMRFPSSTGIAGFALVTRQPLVVDDLSNDPRFSRDRAASTGYVPDSIVATPLLHDERVLGVLSVLDRARDRPFGLAELELLSRFSTQAAIALDLLQRARTARAALGGHRDAGLVGRLAALLDREDTEAARRLLEALEALLVSRGDAHDAP